MIYIILFIIIAKQINVIHLVSLCIPVIVYWDSLAHIIITDKLIRSFIYNQFKYMPFTASSGLSLAHINFSITKLYQVILLIILYNLNHMLYIVSFQAYL